MRKAFLMQVSTSIDAIKKQGIFKAYTEVHELYGDQRKLAKQAKALLAELDKATSKGEKNSKKASKKAKKGTAPTDIPGPELRAIYQQDLEKAKEAAETAKAKMEFAAKEMFRFYGNLLAAKAKYAWNKILKEQTTTDLYKDLQGMSKKGPRGYGHKSFDDCVMFHLLTMFPNNAAEQEKYYLSNMLKKPQRVGVCQFVKCIDQLNTYIVQLPC
jgi:hypothetical protein